MKVTKRYLLHFSPLDFEGMKPAKEDVFYDNKGRIYTQFHKGDLLPVEVWNELFEESKPKEDVEVKKNQVIVDDKKITESSEKELDSPKEVKPRKKRAKSIVKK